MLLFHHLLLSSSVAGGGFGGFGRCDARVEVMAERSRLKAASRMVTGSGFGRWASVRLGRSTTDLMDDLDLLEAVRRTTVVGSDGDAVLVSDRQMDKFGLR
ncbi:hypothetical protein Dimus_018887 [Dionaea muscipula]